MNEMSVKNFCNETLSKTNFPLGRIKVHLILSYLIQSDLQGASDSSDEDDTEDFLSADTYKMVFVVNSELNMGTGKVAAQVAHAALSLFRNMIDTDAKAQMLMVWTHMG